MIDRLFSGHLGEKMPSNRDYLRAIGFSLLTSDKIYIAKRLPMAFRMPVKTSNGFASYM